MAQSKLGYIIWAPNYVSGSAGVKCLYLLCHYLNSLGYKSYITHSTQTTPELMAPLLLPRAAKKKLKSGQFVIVYPEVVSGNPYGAKHVVRWVLNRPGLLGGTPLYHPDEKVFYYSEVYRRYIANPVSGKLYLPTIDESLFFSNSSPSSRHLTAYYVGKSRFQPGYFKESETFEITRDFPKRQMLGEIFRSCKCLYCFDNSSIIIYEAALCGCPVVVIPDGTQTYEDFQKLELGLNGISWGPEHLELAQSTLPQLKSKLIGAQEEFKVQLNQFTHLTQRWEEKTKWPQELYSTYTQVLKKNEDLYYSIPYNIMKKFLMAFPGIEVLIYNFIVKYKLKHFIKRVVNRV